MILNNRLYALLHPTLILLLAASPTLGQDRNMREHLGTRVTATSEEIILDWDPKHPWNADISRGTMLIAEYKTRTQGVVLQKLATGKQVSSNVQSMRFILPAELTVPPTGPVCMFIQLANNRVLPVRKGGDGHADTSRFRDQAWDANAAARSSDSQQREALAAYDAALQQATRSIDLQRQEITRKHHTSPADCDSIAVPSFSSERPFDVLAPADIPSAARRACITRVVRAADALADDLKGVQNEKDSKTILEFHLTHSVMPPVVADGLMKLLPPASRTAQPVRESELAAFVKDWNQFFRAPDPKDHTMLGDEADELDLQSVSTIVGSSVFDVMAALLEHKPITQGQLKGVNPREMAGFAGAELEAYSRCVVDSQKQLQSKAETWQENQRRAPELRESAHRQLVAECRQDFTRLDTLIAQQKTAQERLNAARGTARSTTPEVRPGASSIILNDVACSSR